MKKKKLLSVLLAGAMSASIFVGCGSSATDWDYISNKGGSLRENGCYSKVPEN